MIWVVMKDKRVLQYNACNYYVWSEGYVSLYHRKDGTHIGRISQDAIERLEYEKPCKVLKLKKDGTY